MKRTWLAGLAALVLVVAPAVSKALMIAPPAMPQLVATADLIVTGKVTGFGDKMVKAELYKGDTREMQIAKIKVDSTLVGKGVKEVKVGFFPPMNAPGGGPGRPIIRRGPQVNLKVNEEYALVLTKHPTKDFYIAQNYYDAIAKKDNTNFTKQIDEIKKYAKIMANASKTLDSKDADERFLAAAMLITKYRSPKANQTKTEKVDAKESKKILTILAEADWKKTKPGMWMMSPVSLFGRLGATKADGWDFQFKPGVNYADEAKKWVKANSGKFVIQRYVDTKEKSK